MSRYSQNDEEDVIVQYFARMEHEHNQKRPDGSPRRFLDVGAHDGMTFSNSRRLAELGWGGWLIEPGKAAYAKLATLYPDTKQAYTLYGAPCGNDRFVTVNAALTAKIQNGDMAFICSDVASYEMRRALVKRKAKEAKERGEPGYDPWRMEAGGYSDKPMEARDSAEYGFKRLFSQNADGLLNCAAGPHALKHFAKWHGTPFMPGSCWVMTVPQLQHLTAMDFDAVLIDTEGANRELMTAFPWADMPQIRLICVEHDTHDFAPLLTPLGYSQISHNAENVIYTR